MLVGGPAADHAAFVDLYAFLREFARDSPLFGAVIALSTQSNSSIQIGLLEPKAVDLLQVENITLLAIRPDGYIGLRSDKDHHSALQRYWSLFHKEPV